jgi:hypothetical protein
VHNQEEKDLFRTMMFGNNSFGNFSSEAQVDASVRIWNARADTSDNIFYKVSFIRRAIIQAHSTFQLAEQLRVYYNSDWQRNSNIIQTKATTAQARQPLMKQIHDPNRLLMVPPVPQTTLKLHHAPAGMLSLRTIDQIPHVDTPETSTRFSNGALASFEAGPRINPSAQAVPRISSSGLSSGTSAPSVVAATQFIAGSSSSLMVNPSRSAEAAPVPRLGPQPLSHAEIMQQLAKRKVGEDMQQSEPPPKKPRKGRTCRKCALDSCPGKAKVDYCCNTCKDCGKQGQDKSCRGRNPKFPTKTCKEAVDEGKWD